MSPEAIRSELEELNELAGWLHPSMDIEYAELGCDSRDDDLCRDLDEFESREDELRARIASLAEVLQQLERSSQTPSRPRRLR